MRGMSAPAYEATASVQSPRPGSRFARQAGVQQELLTTSSRAGDKGVVHAAQDHPPSSHLESGDSSLEPAGEPSHATGPGASPAALGTRGAPHGDIVSAEAGQRAPQPLAADAAAASTTCSTATAPVASPPEVQHGAQFGLKEPVRAGPANSSSPQPATPGSGAAQTSAPQSPQPLPPHLPPAALPPQGREPSSPPRRNVGVGPSVDTQPERAAPTPQADKTGGPLAAPVLALYTSAAGRAGVSGVLRGPDAHDGQATVEAAGAQAGAAASTHMASEAMSAQQPRAEVPFLHVESGKALLGRDDSAQHVPVNAAASAAVGASAASETAPASSFIAAVAVEQQQLPRAGVSADTRQLPKPSNIPSQESTVSTAGTAAAGAQTVPSAAPQAASAAAVATLSSLRGLVALAAAAKNSSDEDSDESSDDEDDRERALAASVREQAAIHDEALALQRAAEADAAEAADEARSLALQLQNAAAEHTHALTVLRAQSAAAAEAFEAERQRHWSTRREAEARQAELEAQSAAAAEALAVAQRELEHREAAAAATRAALGVAHDALQRRRAEIAALRRRVAVLEHGDGGSGGAEAGTQASVVGDASAAAERALALEAAQLRSELALLQSAKSAAIQRLGMVKWRAPTPREREHNARLRSITDRLIDTQAQVEAAASEKSGLALRLEAALDGLRALDEASRLQEGLASVGCGAGADSGLESDEEESMIVDTYDEARFKLDVPSQNDIVDS